MLRLRITAAIVLLLSAPAAFAQISAVRVASGLTLPIYVAAPPGDDRLFIVLRGGQVRILDGTSLLPTPFLDISSAVRWSNMDEGGLLSMVFAPDYATSGVFYVYYTTFSGSSPVNMRSVVSRFTVNGDPMAATMADAGSETKIFELDQPDSNHNGATIAIRDGYLYLGLGDGGGSGDPQDRAQNDASLFGKMVRLDLSTPNPDTGDWEIWAKGLRNPYRFSFDRLTGDLYIGDVGQNLQEEIDIVAADSPLGLNFGWDSMEGVLCFDADPGEPPCNDPSLVDPVFTIDHSGGKWVTGGAVYRGSESGSLRGDYFFAESGDRRLFRLRWTAASGLAGEVDEITNEIELVPRPGSGGISQIVAISEGRTGEIYITSLLGSIYKLVPEPGALPASLAALGSLASIARRTSLRGTDRR